MKTDNVRYLVMTELQNSIIRAPSRNNSGFSYCRVVSVFLPDNGRVYLLVRPEARGGPAYKVDLANCRDSCGRRYEVIRGKRSTP